MSLSDCPNCWETPCACGKSNDDGWISPAYPAFIERKQPGPHMAANTYFDLMMRLGVRVRPERLKTLEELERISA